MSDIQSYYVEWFVTRRAQKDVTVRIRDGRLLDVQAGRSPVAVAVPLDQGHGGVALVEGFVNAHTHLEFSNLNQPLPTSGRFTDWIRTVIQSRRERAFDVHDAIRAGIDESLRCGTTLLADIATVGWSAQDYSSQTLPCVVFQEILGLMSERIAQQKTIAENHLCPETTDEENHEKQFEGESFVRGLSPHAPYSTHVDLVRDAVSLAIPTRSTVAMHIAETKAEIELLANGRGEFRELLTDMGLWHDELFRGGQRPMDYLQILAAAPRSLIVHGNYLDDDELQFIADRPAMTLVYCPRTHAAFGHGEHPWRRLRELGGRVAIGTDSRASNPDLSLFAELQFLASRHPDMSHVDLLQLGSIEGRRALGVESKDSANLTLIRFSDASSKNQEPALFAPDSVVIGTMIGGRWVGDNEFR